MSDELRDFCNSLHEQLREKDIEIERLRGAMSADDERLRVAAARVGIVFGCDAAEEMADEIERRTREKTALESQLSFLASEAKKLDDKIDRSYAIINEQNKQGEEWQQKVLTLDKEIERLKTGEILSALQGEEGGRMNTIKNAGGMSYVKTCRDGLLVYDVEHVVTLKFTLSPDQMKRLARSLNVRAGGRSKK